MLFQPSPTEKKSFSFLKRDNSSTSVKNRPPLSPSDEPFTISRESFDSYRRSFVSHLPADDRELALMCVVAGYFSTVSDQRRCAGKEQLRHPTDDGGDGPREYGCAPLTDELRCSRQNEPGLSTTAFANESRPAITSDASYGKRCRRAERRIRGCEA